MIFSERLLFLHVPKAGGSSIVRFLMDVLPKPVYYSLPPDHEAELPDGVIRFPGSAHESLDEARIVLSERGLRLEDFPVVVACIRNPYELEVSRYSFLRGDLNRYNHGVQQAVALQGDFELFATYSRPHGLRPLETYYVLDGVVPPNLRIVRLENVEAELRDCLQAAGVDAGTGAVPRHNRSEHDAFAGYYTPAAEQAVYEKYKWVFHTGLYPRLELSGAEPAASDHAAAVKRVLATLPELERRADHFALANAWLAASEIHRHSFGSLEQYEALERALTHAEHVGSDRLSGRILIHLVRCLSLAGGQTVATGIERYRALLETDDRVAPETRLLLAELLAATGQLEEARRLCAEVRAAVEAAGAPLGQLLAGAATGSIELLAGNAEAAEKAFVRGSYWGPVTFVGDRAQALYRLGRHADADRLARFAAETAPAGELEAQARWRRLRAKLAAREGKSAEAHRFAEAAVELIARCESPNLHADALVDLADVLHSGGRTDEAIDALDEAVCRYERKGNRVSADAARALTARQTSSKEPSRT